MATTNNHSAIERPTSMKKLTKTAPAAGVTLGLALAVSQALAQAVPGGTLDPATIPKYGTPLVIPPVMPASPQLPGRVNACEIPAARNAVRLFAEFAPDVNICRADYRIGLRQFSQQVLPAGFPATTVWGYGSIDVPGTFNNPGFTIEVTKDQRTRVQWVNQLIADPEGCRNPDGLQNRNNPACNFLTHPMPIDQTLHWANPGQDCIDGVPRTDCRGNTGAPYTGPVPMVTHVHGAHVGPESDGYPEAWMLPEANNIPAGYAAEGSRYGDIFGGQIFAGTGSALFEYPNDQPSATLWYHDHSLGITRNNVYLAAAGFYIVREANGGESGLVSGRLPGPAPRVGDTVGALNTPGDPVRNRIREVPIAIQEHSFNADGSFFYPANRAFFEGLGDGQTFDQNAAEGLNIPFLPDPASDISPVWNPEAFFNTMVVNGKTWPQLEVAPERYRLRLVNANDSRFLNLSLYVVNGDDTLGEELPFYQIGAEQSLLARVVKIVRGDRVALPGDGTNPELSSTPLPVAGGEETVAGLLAGPAERPDVIVDFAGLPEGTVVRMLNTGPDEPFGGFPAPSADPGTTGQVMQFVVRQALANPAGDPSTPPEQLVLSKPDPLNAPATVTRDLALLEEESALICVEIDTVTGAISQVPDSTPPVCTAGGVPFAPKAAVLGFNGSQGPQGEGGSTVQLWDDPINQNPAVGAVEIWELWNHSADAHPIHPHLVKFEVVNREVIGSGTPRVPELTESGWKDTVIAYPGEVTRIRAQFDRPGLYVWHCHILSHEDNEMMVPYCVGTPGVDCPAELF
jgi:FtsP/CotA-like multicopper oxidase with cupredoxin domain